MKDQLQLYGQKLLKNIDRVGIAVFAGLLAFAVFLFLQESGHEVEPIETPRASAFDERIPSEDYDKVMASMVDLTPELSERDEFRPLITTNMFSARSVRESADLVRDVEADYTRARAAFDAGNHAEARRLVDGILRRMPTHRRTLELQGQIAEATAGANAAGATQ